MLQSRIEERKEGKDLFKPLMEWNREEEKDSLRNSLTFDACQRRGGKGRGGKVCFPFRQSAGWERGGGCTSITNDSAAPRTKGEGGSKRIPF